jgi:hypothetical protein
MRLTFFEGVEKLRVPLSSHAHRSPRAQAWRLGVVILAMLPFRSLALAINTIGSNSAATVETNFVVAQGANHRIWQNVIPALTNQQGEVVYRTNSYSELATGLNHLVNGQWVASSEDVQITAGGGVATNGPHKVSFSANINSSNAVEIVSPDGKQFKTHVMGMSFYDASSGSNVLFAELQDSTGQVVANNQVVYPNAFSNCNADVRYTYTRAGFEQDIVVQQQLPSPETFGLDPDTTWLQVWTEFTDPPTATIQPILDGTDERLDFGVMKMERGRAFIMGNESNSIPVSKAWRTVQGRTFLVEQVQFDTLTAQMQSLPASSGGAGGTNGTGLQQIRYQGFPKKLPPVPTLVKRDNGGLKLAGTRAPEKGLVLDYAFENGSITNLTLRGDTTYFITGTLNLYGTTTIEGGTVVKFTNYENSVSLNINGPVSCQTGPYQMAVFTAMDDNSVGARIYGSSGNPSGDYALNAFNYNYADAPASLQYLRVSFATFGCSINSPGTNLIRHCQFVDDYFATWLTAGGTVNLQNVLFNNISGDAVFGIDTAINAVNLTVDDVNTFFYDAYGSTLTLTNSLLVSVANPATNYSGSYNFTTNGEAAFQTAGAGAHYLANNSIYRHAGTTNIDTNLLADLQKLTTYPPLYFTGIVTTNTTLSLQAKRGSHRPDVGYHYAPIDYLTACTVTNVTLTLTNGVVLAYYTNEAVCLDNSAQLDSEGSALQRNYLVYYATVQEQPQAVSGLTCWPLFTLPFYAIHTNLGVNPSITASFTTICGPNSADFVLVAADDSSALNSLILNECEIYGGGGFFEIYLPGTSTISLQNNVFQYTSVDVESSAPTDAHNNLFSGPQYEAVFYDDGSGLMTNCDNAYDGNEVYLQAVSGHNAYLNGVIFDTDPQTNDIVTNLTWMPGLLGNYYQAANSPLIDQGSRTAGQAGLYFYTTLTNQAKEGNSMVDIGYHYVALSSNAIPFDMDSNGIPDYVQNPGGSVLIPASWLVANFGTNYMSNTNAWDDPDPDHDGLSNLQEYLLGTDPNNPDTDYDGRSDGQEVAEGTDPLDPNSFLPVRLASWEFDNTNTWVGDQGQMPLCATGLCCDTNGALSNAVVVENAGAALLSYRDVELNGNANINCRQGSVCFWFKPTWTSSFDGGPGPGCAGRLMEMGACAPGSTNGWWALYFDSGGNNLVFATATNGSIVTNLTAAFSWSSNQWHQILLTYNATNSSLYIDLNLIANGLGVDRYPSCAQRSAGFRIGSDQAGANQAGGSFDDLQTFNFALTTNDINGGWAGVYVAIGSGEPGLGTEPCLYGGWQLQSPPILYEYYCSPEPVVVGDTVTIPIVDSYTPGSAITYRISGSGVSCQPTQTATISFGQPTIFWNVSPAAGVSPSSGTIYPVLHEDHYGPTFNAIFVAPNAGEFTFTSFSGAPILSNPILGGNPASPSVSMIIGVYPPERLAYWSFNGQMYGDAGQTPVVAQNVSFTQSPFGSAVLFDCVSNIDLQYPAFQGDGNGNVTQSTTLYGGTPNIRRNHGTIRFWFSPDWTSGTGPVNGMFLEMLAGDWALRTVTNGTAIELDEGSGPKASWYINWTAGQWHQVAVSYTELKTVLYVDGIQQGTNRAGIPNLAICPTSPTSPSFLTSNFRVGTDGGSQQIRGAMDGLETFNYELTAANILSDYQAQAATMYNGGNGPGNESPPPGDPTDTTPPTLILDQPVNAH